MLEKSRSGVLDTRVIASLLVLLATLAGCGGGGTSAPTTTPTTTATNVPLPPGWTSIGPAPPAIEAPVAIDPSGQKIYVGSFGGGMFVSDPAGNAVTVINDGLRAPGVNSLAIAPSDASTLYSALFPIGGIYKSTDGGKTWAGTGETSGAILYLLVDPRSANTAYAAYNGSGFSIRKTVDGGQTWTPAQSGIPAGTAVFALAIDPKNPQILYASTTGAGAFRSTDGGATWTAMNVQPVVWSIAIDPTDSTLLYAGTNGNGVYRSADSGATWTRVGSPGVGVVHALLKVGTRLVAGTANDGVYISDDEGVTWQRPDYPANNSFRSNAYPPSQETMRMVLSLSADASGRIYAGTARQGVWISTDRGRTWNTHAVNVLLTQCACQNSYSVTIGPSGRRSVYLSTNDGGLFVSDFNTITLGTWTNAPMSMFARAPRGLVFNPVRPDSMYVGSFAGSGFFKSDDGGQTWQRRLFGPPTLHVTNIAVTPDGGTIYAMTQGGAGMWKSTDGGDNFQRIDVGVAGGPFLNLAGRGIAVDPQGGPNVYVAAGSGVWRSRDRGATWTRVSTVGSQTVQVHPVDSSIVLVGTQTAGVLKSTDFGATFTPINNGLTDLRTGRFGGVQVHRAKPDTYYVNTEGGGIFKSRDAGATWTAVNRNLGELNVFGLAIDPTDPDTLLAATQKSVYMTRSGGE